jgi:hypothetical protein
LAAHGIHERFVDNDLVGVREWLQASTAIDHRTEQIGTAKDRGSFDGT